MKKLTTGILISTLAVAGGVTQALANGSNTAGQGGNKSLTPITVAYMPNMSGASSVAIAEQQGYFKKAGLDVHTVLFQAGPAEIDAMASGKIDVSQIGPGPIFMAMEGRAKVLLPDNISLGDEVVVSKASGIKSAADLKGKKVLVPLGTTGQIILYETLHSAGLSLNDVQMINTQPTEQVAAFLSNQAPVVAGWDPGTTEILQKAPGSRVLASDSSFYPKVSLPNVWLGSNQFTSSHPDVAKRFMWAILQAMDYKSAHLQASVQLTSKFTNVPTNLTENDAKSAKWPSKKEILQDYKTGVAKGWFDSMAKTYVAMGRLTKVPVFSSYSEPNWVQEASKLNIK